MYAHTCTDMQCIYKQVTICACLYMGVCTHANTHIPNNGHTLCVFVCLYVHTQTHGTHTHTYTHIHTHTHTRTHTHMEHIYPVFTMYCIYNVNTVYTLYVKRDLLYGKRDLLYVKRDLLYGKRNLLYLQTYLQCIHKQITICDATIY